MESDPVVPKFKGKSGYKLYVWPEISHIHIETNQRRIPSTMLYYIMSI
jgi:hypothetical protein